MGADGHIAIYDWEKVQAYLQSATEHYVPKYKNRDFRLDEVSAAEQFVCELDARFPQAAPHRIIARSAAPFGAKHGAFFGWTPGKCPDAEWLSVYYYDHDDREPMRWPGYVCDWTCNGRPACLIYWGDNLGVRPFEDCLWLAQWCDKNALLVADQEVWT